MFKQRPEILVPSGKEVGRAQWGRRLFLSQELRGSATSWLGGGGGFRMAGVLSTEVESSKPWFLIFRTVNGKSLKLF